MLNGVGPKNFSEIRESTVQNLSINQGLFKNVRSRRRFSKVVRADRGYKSKDVDERNFICDER